MKSAYSSPSITPSGVEDPKRQERLRNERILRFKIKWAETLAEHSRRSLAKLTDEGGASRTAPRLAPAGDENVHDAGNET